MNLLLIIFVLIVSLFFIKKENKRRKWIWGSIVITSIIWIYKYLLSTLFLICFMFFGNEKQTKGQRELADYFYQEFKLETSFPRYGGIDLTIASLPDTLTEDNLIAFTEYIAHKAKDIVSDYKDREFLSIRIYLENTSEMSGTKDYWDRRVYVKEE